MSSGQKWFLCAAGCSNIAFSVTITQLPATLHPFMRRDIAIAVLGELAEKDLAIYSSLHQQVNKLTVSNTVTITNTSDEPDFTRRCWDLIHGGALDDDDDDTVTHSTQPLLDEKRKTHWKVR